MTRSIFQLRKAVRFRIPALMKCKRCGICCSEEVCQIGVMAFVSRETPCPGLVKENGLYSCILVVTEKEFGLNPMITEALAIGTECTNA